MLTVTAEFVQAIEAEKWQYGWCVVEVASSGLGTVEGDAAEKNDGLWQGIGSVSVYERLPSPALCIYGSSQVSNNCSRLHTWTAECMQHNHLTLRALKFSWRVKQQDEFRLILVPIFILQETRISLIK